MEPIPSTIVNTEPYITDVPARSAEEIMRHLRPGAFVPITYVVDKHLAVKSAMRDFGVRSFHIQIVDDVIGLYNNPNFPTLFLYNRKDNTVHAREPSMAAIIGPTAYLYFADPWRFARHFRSLLALERKKEQPLKQMDATIFRLFYREVRPN